MNRALIRALLWRCPACGNGSLYQSYMKQAESCKHCRESFKDIQVDDGPAALAILVAGIPMVPLTILLVKHPAGPEWASVLILVLIMAGFVFLTLPSIKGLLIAAKWLQK